ncbi:Aste57867_14924 [Aphanomyces stellatus]|uniref:Aste57867_14924 protein n=1 Tax=Aphanomyces stellatus TaxID=120398 RepID=A0A485L1Y1_9STRA|nr:hypothetical protein As57867_014868 [Aphanomyces stellatus]VFT91739.1 Aste57867_14924 [Aphanomyces stellatus]
MASKTSEAPLATAAAPTYGSADTDAPARAPSPSRVVEEADLQKMLRECVESRRFRNITALLRKKRSLALDLMEREITHMKSGPQGPHDWESLDSVQTLTTDEIAAEEDEEDTQRAENKWRVSFSVERTSRLLIYARQEWKHAQQLAVEAQVAHLIIRCLTPRVEKKDKKGKAGPSTSAKKVLGTQGQETALLELVYEFIAGGYEPAQNALYRAMLEVYDDDDDDTTAEVDRKDIFLRFLLKYVRAADNKPENHFALHYQKMALSVVQLLCENHNTWWQPAMQEPVDGSTILEAVVAVLEATPSTNHVFVKCLRCLSEACQGPCAENQDYLVRTAAPKICCDLLLSDTQLDDDVAAFQASSEVLLSLMEGRTDNVVNAEIARVFSAANIVDRLVLCHRSLCAAYDDELSFERDDIHRHPIYVKAMSMMVVAVRIMSLEALADFLYDGVMDNTGDDDDDAQEMSLKLGEDTEAMELEMKSKVKKAVRGIIASAKRTESLTLRTAARKVINAHRAIKQFDMRSVQGFRTLWQAAIDERKAVGPVKFFHSQLISVELVIRGNTTTLYFIKPHDTMYFDEFLQNELIDEMDIGSDKALEVLISDTAKSIEEELRVMKHLHRHKVYSFLSRWQLYIRTRLLGLCFYINFVMMLLLRWGRDDNYLLLKLLGVAYFVGCCVLLGFYVTKAFNFNYCKQQLSLTKLHFRSPKLINDKIMEAWKEPINVLEIILWTVSLIVYVNGWTSYGSKSSCTVAGLALVISTLRSIREVANVSRFYVNSESTFEEMKTKLDHRAWTPKFLFYYSVCYDTLFSENVLALLAYTFCAIMGLTSHVYHYLFYGFPLLDLVGTNTGLRFVIKAMTSNTSKLTITAIFGAVIIYIFALNGYYFLQDELTIPDGGPQECHSLMECFMTYIHNGLLSGGGIGDYINGHNPLNYTDKQVYFGRVGYDLGYFIIVIVLLLNLIQGIIIDAFTAVREASENKMTLQRQQCLVCNRARTVIETEGMNNGIMNSFARHTETKHNLFHYFFFIKYLKAKDETEMNGMESYVFEKIKTKDMSWVPRI